ncbi:MAG: hypothetical protein ACR2MX_11620, partial [Cyclobacteriaceae bacterium]
MRWFIENFGILRKYKANMVGFYLCFYCLCIPAASWALEPPYPPSPVISDVVWDFSSYRRAAFHSDNHPVTWAHDGNQYTAWGDGLGFRPSSAKKSIGVSRVMGSSAASATFTDVWYGDNAHINGSLSLKSYGILAVGGKLAMFAVQDNSLPGNVHLLESSDLGSTWKKSAFWSSSERIGTPSPLQFGKNYAGARDDFVYVYGPDASGNWNNTYGILLGRVHRNQIGVKSAYQWFSGTASNPQWVSGIQNAKAVFTDANGVGVASVSYNAGLGRYLLTSWHASNPTAITGAGVTGRWGIFDAPEPWGPWTTVAYYDKNWGIGNNETFFYNFSNKWLSADGKDFTLVFTGVGQFDAWNTIKGRFVVSDTTSQDFDPPQSPSGLALQQL